MSKLFPSYNNSIVCDSFFLIRMSDKKYAHIDTNRNRTITVGKSNLFCKFNFIFIPLIQSQTHAAVVQGIRQRLGFSLCRETHTASVALMNLYVLRGNGAFIQSPPRRLPQYLAEQVQGVPGGLRRQVRLALSQCVHFHGVNAEAGETTVAVRQQILAQSAGEILAQGTPCREDGNAGDKRGVGCHGPISLPLSCRISR